MRKKSKVYIPTDLEFKEIVADSNSFSDCLRRLGLGTRGGSSTDVLKERINQLGCSTAHFHSLKTDRSSTARYSLEEILVKNSTYKNIPRLKTRLVNSGLMRYKCSSCGISDWQGKKISLQLDHINGNNTDHRLSNLRLLCPNCHSQTETYAGRNRKS